MTVEVRWGSATHVGCVRRSNQDSILAGPFVFAVADGMGGHAAGEVASAIAVARMADLDARPTGEQILAAVRTANSEVIAQAAQGSGREGMGTTLSGVAIADHDGEDSLLVFNVGDSRTYKLDADGLTQITSDHSLVAEMVRDGELAPDDAAKHRSRNVITRALGIAAEVRVDHWWIAPAAGQVFLLCSDGLHNEVPPPVIEGVLRAASSPQAAVDALMGIALDAGARDNVSAIAVWIDAVGGAFGVLDEDTARRATEAASAAHPLAPAPTTDHEKGQLAPGAPVTSTPGLIGVEPPSPAEATFSAEPSVGLIDFVPGAAPEPAGGVDVPGELVTSVPSPADAAGDQGGR